MTVAVVAAARTPIAADDGVFARWQPVDITALVLRELTARGRIDPAVVDVVWAGCAEPVGAQGADVARAAVLAAGWPERVGGTVVDRAETSGTAALAAAADAVLAHGSTAVVLGVSSASTVRPGASALGRTYGRPWGDAPAARYESSGGLLPPPRVAERHTAAAGISRAIHDEVTLASHRLRRAASPPAAILEVAARPADGSTVQRNAPIATDVLRPAPADPADLPPAYADDGLLTAASNAPPADGVTGLVLAPDGTPGAIARLRAAVTAAGSPFDATGDAAGALDRALERAGLDRSGVARWEVAESSAAGFLALAAVFGACDAPINPDGGAIATGDAAAAEELRLGIDALLRSAPGEIVVALAGGPTGAAISVWERLSADPGS